VAPTRFLTLAILALLAVASPARAGADPRSEAAMGAGMRAIQQQDWQGAVKRLEVAIVFDPANADAYERLGYAHQQLGNSDKALKYFSIALDIDPNNVAALSRHGQVMVASGNVDRAKADLQRLSRKCGAGCALHDELQRALDYQRAKQ